MRARYVLHPGWIYSKSDHDRHYIGIGQLIDLYHLDVKTDYMVLASEPSYHPEKDLDIHCRPKYFGDYPDKKPEL